MPNRKQKRVRLYIVADAICAYKSKADWENGYDDCDFDLNPGDVIGSYGDPYSGAKCYTDQGQCYIDSDFSGFIEVPLDFDLKAKSIMTMIEEHDNKELLFKKSTIKDNIRRFELAMK